MQTHRTTAQRSGMGGRIAAVRKSRELTQVQLARLVDVNPITISRFERGASEPRRGTLDRLAKVLRTSPAWLMFGVEGGRNG